MLINLWFLGFHTDLYRRRHNVECTGMSITMSWSRRRKCHQNISQPLECLYCTEVKIDSDLQLYFQSFLHICFSVLFYFSFYPLCYVGLFIYILCQSYLSFSLILLCKWSHSPHNRICVLTTVKMTHAVQQYIIQRRVLSIILNYI